MFEFSVIDATFGFEVRKKQYMPKRRQLFSLPPPVGRDRIGHPAFHIKICTSILRSMTDHEDINLDGQRFEEVGAKE